MNVVAIPTLGKSPLLWPLLHDLTDGHRDPVWVFDNGMCAADKARLEGAAAMCRQIVAVDAATMAFYAMWNQAITRARDVDADYLAVLNDDLRVHPAMIGLLAQTMDENPDIGIACPDYRRKLDEGLGTLRPRDVSGTYRTHGIAGFCFMVRAQTCPLINPDLEIWYGDDDLVEKIIQQGLRACIIEGLPLEHEESTTVNQCDWVPAAIARDRERWANRHV